MTSITFPNIEPTERRYNPGNFPQRIFESQNGASTVIRYGSRRVNASLQLGFSNITDAQAAAIVANYEDVNSVWNNVIFTASNGLAGVGTELAVYLQENGLSGLKWRYVNPPQVSSVYPGISSVNCSFVAYLDGD